MAAQADRPHRDPALLPEQIIQVYEESGRSIDPATLQEVSDRLFPDSGVRFYCLAGGGRGYINEDGSMSKPKYTIGTGPTPVAIMEDGTALPY